VIADRWSRAGVVPRGSRYPRQRQPVQHPWDGLLSPRPSTADCESRVHRKQL